MRTNFFPIDRIERGSKVVLYGAGQNALNLRRCNDNISWCTIVGALDKKARSIREFPLPVLLPEEIVTLGEWDYVLVTILDKGIRDEIKKYLVNEIGIEPRKIITDIECAFGRDEKEIIYYKRNVAENSPLEIAIWAKGAMGDHIIFLKMYQEIVRLAPQGQITVLTEHDTFPTSILFGQKNLKKIEQVNPDWGGGDV